MKKNVSKIFVTVMVLMVALNLVACSQKKQSEYVGTWKAASVTSYGVTINDPASMGFDMSLELKADGTANISMTINNKSESFNDTWKETDKGISFESDSSVTANKTSDGKLELALQSNNVIMYLEKQPN